MYIKTRKAKIELKENLIYCLVEHVDNDWCDRNGDFLSKKETLKRLKEHGFINGKLVQIPKGIYNISLGLDWSFELDDLAMECPPEFDGQVEFEILEESEIKKLYF